MRAPIADLSELTSERPAAREAASVALEISRLAESHSSDPEVEAQFEGARQLISDVERAAGFQGSVAVQADYSALEKIRISQPLSYLLTIDHQQRIKLLDYILRVETFLYSRSGMRSTLNSIVSGIPSEVTKAALMKWRKGRKYKGDDDDAGDDDDPGDADMPPSYDDVIAESSTVNQYAANQPPPQP